MPEELVPSEMKPLFTEDELHNLRSIKLSNGNDILACILALDEKTLVVKRPCQVLKMVNEDNAIVVLTKWQQFSVSENHVINSNAIVSYCKVSPEMEQYYIQNVKQQLAVEAHSKEPSIEYAWPEWTDKPIKQQIT